MSDVDVELIEDPEGDGEPENPPAPLIELFEVLDWQEATDPQWQ